MNYRPDIDGLRAIAVLSVLLFHIDKNLVPGGYAGVDVFFVISGYLITLLIYGQMHRGDFNFADFYRRRINRIVPALFGVIGGVVIAGMAIISPLDLIRLVKSGVSAALGISNVFIWREYGNYFSSGVEEAPLLHTWSLGVEEQFYVVWPIALLFIHRLKPAMRAILIAVLLAGTFFISEFGVRNAASASYYLLPTRFFELLIGGGLAMYLFHRSEPFSRSAANLAGLIGLALTFGCFWMLKGTSAFPGINALYPCLGAALLIAAGTRTDTWTARVLGSKPLVFVGLISYSLYLWHWPIIAFIHYRAIPVDLTVGTIVFFGSLVVGWLSWKFIEVPFRRRGHASSFLSVFGWRYAMPLAAVALISLTIIKMHGLPSRFDPRIGNYEKIIATAPNELRSDCHSPTIMYERKPSPSCVLGKEGKPAEALLIGDSFANHFTGMVDVLAKQDNIAVSDYTMDGCMPVQGMGFGAVPAYAEKCKKRNEFNYKFISEHKYKYVILAGSWPNEGSGEMFSGLTAGFERSIASIVASGAEPVVILNNQGTDNANCPIRRLMAGSVESCDRARTTSNAQQKMFSTLKAKFPQLSFVDPNIAICKEGICHSMLGDTPLFRDGEHLNDVGSRLIGKVLLQNGVHLTAVGN